jgi:hypothetical protein
MTAARYGYPEIIQSIFEDGSTDVDDMDSVSDYPNLWSWFCLFADSSVVLACNNY